MATLQPYLQLGGQTEAAMDFYATALGGVATLQRVSDTPMAESMPEAMHDRIVHAALLVNDATMLMASDMMELDEGAVSQKVALTLDCSSQEEIERLFAALKVDGTVTHELGTAFWGATYGEVTDKYGMRWMFNFQEVDSPEPSDVIS